MVIEAASLIIRTYTMYTVPNSMEISSSAIALIGLQMSVTVVLRIAHLLIHLS